MTAALRHGLIDTAAATIAATAADRWLRPICAGAGVVFTLHRVRAAEPDRFEPSRSLGVTPEVLQLLLDEIAGAGLDVVSLDDVQDRLRQPRGRRFAAITFDDGYRDTLEVAHPVLRRASVPWAMFVVPDFMDGGGRAWWLELEQALRNLDRVDLGGDCGSTFATRSSSQKRRVYEVLRLRLQGASAADRNAVLDRLAGAAGLAGHDHVSRTFASGEEVAVAARDDALTIGSHTLSHDVLANCDDLRARAEIEGSKARLQRRLGFEIRHLAYPHGGPWSCGTREFRSAAAAGYVSAWTTEPRHLFAGDAEARWSLPRVSLNGRHTSRAMLRAMLSGAAFPFQALGESRRRADLARRFSCQAQTR